MKWSFGLFKAKPPSNIWVTEEALGDNNCVFNAWTLGLSQRHVLDQIEKCVRHQKKSPNESFHQFIVMAAEALGVAESWKAVKEKMLKLRERDRELLQAVLAPVMRELAIEVMYADFEHRKTRSEYYINLESTFAPEWEKYVLARFNRAVTHDDDIFMHHAFIGRYFAAQCEAFDEKMSDAELAAAIHAKQATIMQWWSTHGYARFLQEMSADGEWGGDFELKALAQYFHVNLIQENHAGFKSVIYSDHGALPVAVNGNRGLETNDLRQLTHRGVIESYLPNPENNVLLRLHDESEIERALLAVPQLEQVQQFININRAALYGARFNQREEFSSSCLQALTVRGAIVKRQGQYYFNLSDANEALARINTMDNAKQIKYYVKKGLKQLPCITLQHTLVDGCFPHWNHCRPFATMLEALRFRIQEMSKAKTTKWQDLIAKVEESAADRQQDRAALRKKITSDLIKKSDTHNIKSIQQAVHVAVHARFPEYQIAKTKKVIVSKQEQIKLDELLALKLQKEEIALYERSMRWRR